MSRLESFGLIRVGEWRLDGRIGSGVSYQLSALASDRVLYCFATDSRARYVGVCDSSNTTLTDRMDRYKYRKGGETNTRMARAIADSLKAGTPVEIWAIPPTEGPGSNGVHVDLVKGLENPLIEALDPDWNRLR